MRHALAIALMLTTAPAFAADLKVASKVDAVTVYPDGATVTRIITFDAPAGDTTLVADDFPLGLDQASLRLDASDAPGMAVAGIDAREVFPETPAPDAGLDKALQDLQDKRSAVDDEIDALKQKKGFIERIAKTTVAGNPKNDGDKPFDAAALRTMWNTVGEDLGQVNDALRQAAIRTRDIDREIEKLNAGRSGGSVGEKRLELRIALTADQAAKGSLAVSYVIGNAGWTPLYDARLDSTKGALEIVRRARITQATGEDWDDVALTVSTARATAGASVPVLDTKLVTLLQPPIVFGAAREDLARKRFSRQPELEAAAPPAPEPVAPAAMAAPKPGREQEAQLDTGGFQSSWALPARTAVPSGSAAKTLRLASFALTPDVVARAAPALQTSAYLEARFDLGEETPLFPGRVSIYRDGFYAGQTDMPLATRGENVRLGFGADDRIKIGRVVTRKVESDPGTLKGTRTDRRDFKVTVRNGRPSPIKVSIEEALPVSEIADVKVEYAPQMTPPTEKNAGNRRGVMAWTYDLAPGATQDIKFGYKVSWPGDLEVRVD